jgi:hypothetical protein
MKQSLTKVIQKRKKMKKELGELETLTNQLRELHIDLLKAIKKAETIENKFEERFENTATSSYDFARDYTFKIIGKLESVIYNELFNIKDYLEIDWKEIDEKEI